MKVVSSYLCEVFFSEGTLKKERGRIYAIRDGDSARQLTKRINDLIIYKNSCPISIFFNAEYDLLEKYSLYSLELVLKYLKGYF